MDYVKVRLLSFVAIQCDGFACFRCPRGSVGMAALLCRWQTAGGGSIPCWSASKPQVVTRRKAKGADQKKKRRLHMLFTIQSRKINLCYDLAKARSPKQDCRLQTENR